LLFACFDRGILTRLRLDAGTICALAPLRRLFVSEPVSEVLIGAGGSSRASAVAFRTLLPFPWPVRVAIERGIWTNDALLSALVSCPLLSSATELSLRGYSYRGEVVTWLAKAPFLGAVRSLNLAQNGLTDAHAGELARVANLRNVRHLDVSGNRIGEAGKSALRARFGEGLVANGAA
jgi:hypothetical protein